jgi:hypothetical protein
MDPEQDPTSAPEPATDGGESTPAFAPHPAMSPHGMLTPADGFQSLLGAISAQSAPSLIIQVMGFLSQRPNFFPSHGAEWARWCAATADVIAATTGTTPAAPHPAPAGNLP